MKVNRANTGSRWTGARVLQTPTAQPQPVDEQGLPDPHWSTEHRLLVAQIRCLASIGIVPYASRYLCHPAGLAAVVDDVVRRLYREYRVGVRMDYRRFLRAYVDQVEASAASQACDAELTRVWVQHAGELRKRWGDGLLPL